MAENQNFLNKAFHLLEKSMAAKNYDRENALVVDYRDPKDMAKEIDFDLEGNGRKYGDDELLQDFEKTIKLSVNSGHPHFFNQMFTGHDPYAVAAGCLLECRNTSLYTYEMAPVFTLAEKSVINYLASLTGFGESYNGIFVPGGSMGNFFGLNLARNLRFPSVKEKGMTEVKKMAIFASEQCHYSIGKGAAFLGYGIDAVKRIRCEESGRMSVEALREKVKETIEEGIVPLMVVAVSGTTVMGAFDDLEGIAKVCKEFSMYMHVDGCWGGPALLSEKRRHLLKGIEHADSFVWDAHKMFGATQQCAVFVTKHKDLLKQAHGQAASYLFQPDRYYDVAYDSGDMSIQCGRKADAFKAWFILKARGKKQVDLMIDHAFGIAEYFADLIRDTEGFKLVHEPQCTNVCFWYIPPCLRGNGERDDKWWQRLGKVAPKIKEKMMRKGSMMIGYQPLGHRVNFFRIVIPHLNSTKEDMEFVRDEINRLGKDIIV
ncbi:DgyrCDS2745 [Dimorphilus gyrociliatus]|uniref:DgyrCDS2745 n=1 Tax=Dimorphilus gyrociliatus TaxID=2664684 RepID=A0A7I8VCG0_9ANNE|nr:DgyrCDS2745 [Dimorphilus gyrociliatus]